MKKHFFLMLGILMTISSHLFAQPEVSTSSNPKWYFIEVRGNDERSGMVFTNESNVLFGRERIYSATQSKLNSQLWRFELDADGNYIFINKAASTRKMDVFLDSETGSVRVIINRTPTTAWKINKKGNYFGIQAVTTVSGKSSYKFIHQGNSYKGEKFPVVLETSTWENDRNSNFSFVEYEDPNLVMSDSKSQTWYVIKSNRAGCENKCITDIVSSALPNICFGIDDYKEDDYSQQWKAIKKGTTSKDTRFELVNRATGNIIQADYLVKDGYQYTKATQTIEESNGWNLDYIANKEYILYGKDSDGLTRYLNTTAANETPEAYNENSLIGSGFSWNFVKGEVTMDIDYIAKPNDWDNINIYSIEGRIFVEGVDDFTVRTLTGVTVNKNTSLPLGVYLVTVNNKTKAVTNY
ncbi:hypothetical protein M2138_000511 [Dysgonomonadaceae bacterium PH5-43]|nr:hypothetical protein [Dysgonomonadaceae bacterium PH5-43]